jgi:hypothetical protein
MASPHRWLRALLLLCFTPAAAGVAAAAGEPSTKPIVIGGRVLDHQGHIVPKAEVWLPLRWDAASVAHGHANERGEYQLTIPGARGSVGLRSTVFAHAAGRALGTASVWAALFDGSQEPVDVKLAAASTASIVVLDPDGEPVVGATVTPLVAEDRIDALLAAVTDAQGRARLPGVAVADLHHVRVAAEEFGTVQQTPVLRSGQHEGTIRLRPVGRVEGQVFAKDRELLRGMKFKLISYAIRDGEGVAVVECGADGKFVVPRIATGELQLGGLLDSRLPLRLRPRFDGTVTASETVTLEMDLVPGVIVRGRVQLAQSGKALAREGVLFIYGGRQSERVETDADGRFEARVLPGHLRTSVYLPLERQLFQRSGNSASVPDGVTKYDWPVIELAKLIRHEGRLIDKDGKPVADATIFGSRGYGNCTTDREGKFSIVLLPDNDSFRVRLGGTFYEAALEKTDPLLLKLPVAIK